MSEIKKPIGWKLVISFLLILVFGYLISSCQMMTDKDATSIVNTAWWAEGQHYVYFNADDQGIYDDSTALIPFTYKQQDAYIQAYYDDEMLEFTRLKGNKLFLVSENMFFYPHETTE